MLHLYANYVMPAINYFSLGSDNGFMSEPSWFTPEAIKCITDIDGNEYIGDGVSKSKYLGILAPQQLSGGAKTLIYAMANPDEVVSLDHCGQNCAPVLNEISKTKDLTLTYSGSHFVFEDTQNIHCMEHDCMVVGMRAYYDYLLKYNLMDDAMAPQKLIWQDYEDIKNYFNFKA